jgi:predicted secreted hydrolase
MSKNRQKKSLLFLCAAILIAAIAAAYHVFHKVNNTVMNPETELDVTRFLSDDYGDNEHFLKVTYIRPFTFPEDYGPHPEYRSEWWYFTGNLRDQLGRKFGFQMTFFRNGIHRIQYAQDMSNWRTDQIYMAHFALTDVGSKKHYTFERFSRGAVDLAGAQSTPFHVWLENWRAESRNREELFPLTLKGDAHDEENNRIAINLELDTVKPLVLQGNQGLSRKSAKHGNASYYYSFTRLPTRGTITIGEEIFMVVGSSWLDREWSTSSLSKEQAGWDWFSLQLDDEREIMFFQIRLKNGGVDPVSQGVLVNPDGSYQTITRDDILYKALSHWESPQSKRYPSEWHFQLPKESIDLKLRPLVADQEMRLSFTYWEGAVEISGSHSGVGYIELTGY